MREEVKNLDYETRRETMEQMKRVVKGEPEMTEFQSAFLCGLLEMKKPRKILEIGIAGGATTAIIVNKMEKMQCQCEMFSCDLRKEFRDLGHSGFLADDFIKRAKYVKHRFLLGNFFPHFATEVVGKDRDSEPIDFVIIDTVHSLPGEILDFLAVYPLLAEDAIVCLHDISRNYGDSLTGTYFATGVLYASVVADKFLNFEMNDSVEGSDYPNIGAFRITNDTKKYILDVFNALFITWTYMPEKEELDLYANYYQDYYDEQCLHLYKEAITMNRRRQALRKNMPLKDRLLAIAIAALRGPY
ncbi:MAG: class I SAM-dependent methyltransferase [Schwartzia succinivorans]|nr:class I SAM-dependent methyltransferase [Schwartzia succinivorans]